MVPKTFPDCQVCDGQGMLILCAINAYFLFGVVGVE